MNKIIFLAITSIFIIPVLIPQIVFGIGMITEPLILKNVLRDQEVLTTVTLLNSEDKEIIYELSAEGQVANWASFYAKEDQGLENPITKILVSPKSYLETIVKFNIPKDAPNGDYAGQIVIMTIPTEQQAGETSASVRLKVGRDVSITVTDKEIINFETTIIPAKYGVTTGEPLKIKVIYENEGNVSVKPDIQLKITQIGTGNIVHNAIYPYPETEKAVKPLERKVLPDIIEWQTMGQKGGTYKAETTVLLNNQIIKQEGFRFTIGYKTNLFLAAISRMGNGDLVTGWFVSAGFLLMLAVILITINKKRSSRKVHLEV